MTTSFPYFQIAKRYGADYAAVLRCVDDIESTLNAKFGIELIYQKRWGLTPPVAQAVRDAVVAEHRRRVGGEDDDAETL